MGSSRGKNNNILINIVIISLASEKNNTEEIDR